MIINLNLLGDREGKDPYWPAQYGGDPPSAPQRLLFHLPFYCTHKQAELVFLKKE